MLGRTISSVLIILLCGCFLVYWFSRVMMLFHGPEVEINETLARDLRRVRKLLLAVRSIFTPPNLLAG